MRATTSMVSRISCFSSGLMSMIGGGEIGERAGRRSSSGSPPAVPAAPAAGARPSPPPGSADAGSAPRSRSSRASGSGMRSTRATRNGHRSRKSSDLEPLVALANEVVAAVRRGDVAQDVGDASRSGAGRRAAGSSTAGSFCMRMPICRWSRSACWAAATERGRSTATGITTPGTTRSCAPAR